MSALELERHLVLFNGPPRAGKSLASRMLLDVVGSEASSLYISEQIKRATHCAYGMFDVPFDHFEGRKDVVSEMFLGLTPRQAYIAHSEAYMKKMHGDDVFIKIFMRSVVDRRSAISVVPDVGFQAEIDYMRTVWPGGRITLLRMHRAGASFDGDARSFVRGGPGVEEIDIRNETVEQLKSVIEDIASRLFVARRMADASLL
jgi:hypothetical protein